jgi:hypothetical protein
MRVVPVTCCDVLELAGGVLRKRCVARKQGLCRNQANQHLEAQCLWLM